MFLIQKAIEEQSSLEGFDPKSVLKLIQYSSQRAGDMCSGQAMDLNSKGMALSLEQLNTVCYYKTGIAFEASLVMPAILAQVKETEIAILKKFAYHAGIAFRFRMICWMCRGTWNSLANPADRMRRTTHRPS
ncbi:Farnesyl diphosphate synthase [Actinobacillus pleuropneumoniae]|nr:Farnesyl diphosphate synthase [Actinobacillus pleuropneumoniae]